MKNLIVGIALGIMVMMIVMDCGFCDDNKHKASICERCDSNSDCISVLSCEDLYNLDTGQSAGNYCIDRSDRVCRIGDDLIGKLPSSIMLSAAQEVINADESNAGNTITITAMVTVKSNVQSGKEVTFEITAKPAGSLASINPATAVTDANGEATTELSAGTVAGGIVIKGTVEDVSGEVTVTVAAGAPTGIVAVGSTEQYICCECKDFAVQLVDQFENAVHEAGVEVSITATTEAEYSITDPTITTNSNGRGIFEFCFVAEINDTATITAAITTPVTCSVNFLVTKRGDCLLETFLGEPAYRMNTLQTHPDLIRCEDLSCSNCIEDHTCNALGGPVIGSFFNPEIQSAIYNGNANIVFIYRGLTVGNWADTIVDGAIVGGLCGESFPGGPVNACSGVETEFFIDPEYYDTDTEELYLLFCGIPINNGNTEFEIETFYFPVFTDPDIVYLEACGVYGNMTVAANLETAGGVLSGAITEASLQDFFEELMPEMWGLVESMIGEPDTLCGVELAYSVRMNFTSVSVDLYLVPVP
ncbi:MAG: hypothetical protein JSU92_04190 [Deltaproteobacteria bacterium]|nr:MAG: hypothetical protein JSU92_04190 [Deltaproteobacteria bacterium]